MDVINIIALVAGVAAGFLFMWWRKSRRPLPKISHIEFKPAPELEGLSIAEIGELYKKHVKRIRWKTAVGIIPENWELELIEAEFYNKKLCELKLQIQTREREVKCP